MKEKENKKLDKSLKLLAKTSFIVLITIIISKILAYFYRISIARLPNGPEIYGLFSLASLISILFISVFSFGLSGGLVRYISYYLAKKEYNKIKYIIRVALIISLISGFIATLILIFSANFISVSIFHTQELTLYIFWFSLLTIPYMLFGIFMAVIQAYQEINAYSFIRNILENAARISVLLLLLFIGLKSSAVIWSYIAGSLLVAGVAFYFCKYRLIGVFGKYKTNQDSDKKISKELFSYSWPLIFLSIFMLIFTSSDSFVIGYFRNVQEVGIYNAAVPLAALLCIAPMLFIQLFFPLITKEYANKNHKLINETSKQVGKWIFIINLPIFIILILFPGAIINLFFGPNYIAASNSLKYLAIGSFFYSIFLVSENLISMSGKSKVILINTILTALINILLDIILVPKYGMDGAAFATMVVYIFWSIITVVQAKKYTNVIPLKRKMILIILISLIPLGVLLITKLFISVNIFSLIAEGLLFLLLYIILIITFKGLDENDWMIINSFKDKLFAR